MLDEEDAQTPLLDDAAKDLPETLRLGRVGLSRASLLRRTPGVDQPEWLDRLADVAQPPVPGSGRRDR